MAQKESKRWDEKRITFILLLVFLFPVGLYVMWRYAHWSRSVKIAVTVAVAFFAISPWVGMYNSTPVLKVDGLKSERITTDNAEFVLTGRTSSIRGTSLTIEGRSVLLINTTDFSHKVLLVEGDNKFTLIASNVNGETKMTITIHRTTSAELAARPQPAPALKVSFNDFYKWVKSDRFDDWLNNMGNPMQIIATTCGKIDSSFGSSWVECMQKGYKDYLKPDTFMDGKWQGDYSTMMGHINNAMTQESLYGTDSKTEQWKKDTQAAEQIYYRIALVI